MDAIFDGCSTLLPAATTGCTHFTHRGHRWLRKPSAESPGEDSDHDVNMAMLTVHQMSHQMNGCNPTCGSNNMFEPERWATKGGTVGGFVPVTHANVWSSTQHSNSGMMVQLAYHRLYNRPASPLSCLCSSSCSSPLLNKTQVWRWGTSTGHKISLSEGKSEFYSSQAASSVSRCYY